MKKKNMITLNQFIEKEYGKRGVVKREKFEADYEKFKLGFLLQQARITEIRRKIAGNN